MTEFKPKTTIQTGQKGSVSGGQVSYTVTSGRGGIATITKNLIRIYIKELSNELPKQLRINISGDPLKNLNRRQVEILQRRLRVFLNTCHGLTTPVIKITPDSRVIQIGIWLERGHHEELLLKIAQFLDEVEFDQLPEAS